MLPKVIKLFFIIPSRKHPVKKSPEGTRKQTMRENQAITNPPVSSSKRHRNFSTLIFPHIFRKRWQNDFRIRSCWFLKSTKWMSLWWFSLNKLFLFLKKHWVLELDRLGKKSKISKYFVYVFRKTFIIADLGEIL